MSKGKIKLAEANPEQLINEYVTQRLLDSNSPHRVIGNLQSLLELALTDRYTTATTFMLTYLNKKGIKYVTKI